MFELVLVLMILSAMVGFLTGAHLTTYMHHLCQAERILSKISEDDLAIEFANWEYLREGMQRADKICNYLRKIGESKASKSRSETEKWGDAVKRWDDKVPCQMGGV